MSLIGSSKRRFLLHAVTGVEVPVLSTKRLHVMYKFQRDDIVLSANCGPTPRIDRISEIDPKQTFVIAYACRTYFAASAPRFIRITTWPASITVINSTSNQL